MAPLRVPLLRPRLADVRRLSRATVFALTVIVVTGGGVRLSRSGLGCDSWPNCGNADGWHAIVEFGNRLAGVAVGLVIAALAIAILRLPARRPDLRRSVYALGVGFIAQAVLGAFSVLLKLAPLFVVAHFLLSMVLLAIAAVLHARTRPDDGAVTGSALRPELPWLATALVAGTAFVLALGTLTTGTGAHSGANPLHPAERFTFLPLHTMAMLHGNAAVLVVGLAVANLFVVRVAGAPVAVRRSAALVVLAVCAQALIGFVQYALAIPAWLVGLHMVGATLLWLAALGHLLEIRRTVRGVPTTDPASVVPARA